MRWDRLLAVLREPDTVARDVYGWGTPSIDAERLFGALVPLSFALAAPGQLHYPEPGFVQAVAPGATPSPDGPDPQLWVPVFEAEELSLLLAVFAVPTATATEKQALAFTLVPAGELETEVSLGWRADLEVRGVGAGGVGCRTGASSGRRPGGAPRRPRRAGGLRRWPDRGRGVPSPAGRRRGGCARTDRGAACGSGGCRRWRRGLRRAARRAAAVSSSRPRRRTAC